MGEGEQAVENTQRALKLTPLDPHRYFYDSLASTACLPPRTIRSSARLAQRSLRANRKHTSTLRALAVASGSSACLMQARQTCEELLKLRPYLYGQPLAGVARRSAPYRLGEKVAEALRGCRHNQTDTRTGRWNDGWIDSLKAGLAALAASAESAAIGGIGGIGGVGGIGGIGGVGGIGGIGAAVGGLTADGLIRNRDGIVRHLADANHEFPSI